MLTTPRSDHLASFRFAVLALVAATLTLVPIQGCQSGGLAGMFGSKTAMEMLAPALKDAANSYINSLGGLASDIESIHGYQDAINVVQKIQPKIKEASSAYQTLAATSGEDRKNLISAFGPKFDATNSSFTSQLDRVKGNSTWGQVVGPMLGKVNLFK